MIQKLTHTTIYVIDQERAKAFYTEKLGFELRTDQVTGNFRWLTVSPKGEPEHELVLMSVSQAPKMDEESRAMLKHLVESGQMGACVFGTQDCRKTYAELKARGVPFRSEPVERCCAVAISPSGQAPGWLGLLLFSFWLVRRPSRQRQS